MVWPLTTVVPAVPRLVPIRVMTEPAATAALAKLAPLTTEVTVGALAGGGGIVEAPGEHGVAGRFCRLERSTGQREVAGIGAAGHVHAAIGTGANRNGVAATAAGEQGGVQDLGDVGIELNGIRGAGGPGGVKPTSLLPSLSTTLTTGLELEPATEVLTALAITG